MTGGWLAGGWVTVQEIHKTHYGEGWVLQAQWRATPMGTRFAVGVCWRRPKSAETAKKSKFPKLIVMIL